jgi:hypothetical protein
MWVKTKNIRRTKSRGTLPNSQHFKGREVWWSSRMGLGSNDKQLIHSFGSAQTKQHVDYCIVWAFLMLGWTTGNLGLKRFTTAQTWREATTFPLIVFFTSLHRGHIQMAFCLGNGSLEIPTTGIPMTLGAHNFACTPRIVMRL